MTILEALILGLVQGLTEFLPVSSSGHIELGKLLLDTKNADNLLFVIVVHAATVLSILVVFRKDIFRLLSQTLQFKNNAETHYLFKIVLSMIPAAVVGLLLEERIESLFNGRGVFVGSMLLITGLLLALSNWVKKHNKDITYKSSFIIGIAQAIAILPGISRSGATIVTALLMGIDKDKATRFSFLMVILPILGATLIKAKELTETPLPSTELLPLVIGFLAAFISGLIACKWMLKIVRSGKLIYFSIYCFIIGIIAIISSTI